MKHGIYISPTEFVSFAEARRTPSLSDEIATRAKSMDAAGLAFLLPNPDPILKRQGKDLRVYRDLRSDAHVGGCIRRRKAAVKALERRVLPGKAGARATRRAEDVLGRLDMDRVMNEVLDGVLFGWQPLEVMWGKLGGAMAPVDVVGKLEAMVQDAVAAIPDDSSISILEATGKGASADLYRELLMFCRSEVSIALLGQNQSTEASSTHASAAAGLEVTHDIRDGDARLAPAAEPHGAAPAGPAGRRCAARVDGGRGHRPAAAGAAGHGRCCAGGRADAAVIRRQGGGAGGRRGRMSRA